MKICKIIIKDFHQFKDFELDLTHPETGEPLEKVCFIGSNGTGKTKLLRILGMNNASGYASPTFYKVKTHILPEPSEDNYYWICHYEKGQRTASKDIEKIPDWQSKLVNQDASATQKEFFEIRDLTGFVLKGVQLNIFVPAEVENNSLINTKDVPVTNVDEALAQHIEPIFYHIVSNETITDFWKTLIYHLKKRDNDFLEFQNVEENQNRTVREVKEMFDQQHPKILDSLAKLWDEILGKAGLEFDAAGASNPIQLTDNLKAYIKLKSTGERINYNDLSTGIRNFIFKVGHIYSLYFNRPIERGFLLVDEPENSLFPDFLYDLVDIYRRITHNTQIFMATHNPIIAAQFEPYERFVLEFDEHGYVRARRGTVPVGDDPNDILSKDFGVRSLLGKEGVKKWERYIELRTLIKLTENKEEKSRMLDEFMRIGNEYNFANAVS